MVGNATHEPIDTAVVAMLDSTVADIVSTVSTLPTQVGIETTQRFAAMFAASELELLARLKAEGASDRAARKAADANGTRSKKAASKATKRADTTAKNPDLADDVRNGNLGDEQLDAISRADDESDGDAANDPDLINSIKTSPPDSAGKIVNRWLDERDQTRAQSRHDRQRARRFARKVHNPTNGNEDIILSGDAETRTELWAAIERRANELYQADGGRDVPDNKHARSRAQRLYDAAAELLLGSATDATGRSSARAGATHPRHMLHIQLTIDPNGDLIGFGPDGHVPDSILSRFGCIGELALTVFDTAGRTLWHDRTKRHATADQFSALIARDCGCVRCHAPVSQCEAHHLTPWGAPSKGKTDIDELALLCRDCHRFVHDHDLTVYWKLGQPQPNGLPTLTWHTRPATAAERPPPKPPPNMRRTTDEARPTRPRDARYKPRARIEVPAARLR